MNILFDTNVVLSNAQAIVTRDAVGFKYAKIPVYSPEELIKITQPIKIIEKNG